jgi:hypothetical protein
MPTVIRKNGFQIIIWTDDHPPMHVHVFKAESELIVNLGDEQTSATIRNNYAMSRRDARQALRLIEENQNLLIEVWRQIHG